MHPPPYYAVHPHAMVHHHHHHHLMQVSSLEDDGWFEQKLHQYEDIMKMLLKRMEMAIAGSSSFLPVPVQLQRECSSPKHPGEWASLYPATSWQLDMTNNHHLDITKNHHPDNKTSSFLDIKNNHQPANQAPAGPPIPTSAASRYPPPSSQHRNPQFTSLEVIIIKMSPFPCCWLYHFPSSGGETSWGRRCRVDFSTNPSVRFSPLHNPQRNPFPPRKRAPTSGSKSWGPERLMTDQWKQGLANIFGHN